MSSAAVFLAAASQPAEPVELLLADAAVGEVPEFRVELPYEFSREDYEQILHDLVRSVAPRSAGHRPTT